MKTYAIPPCALVALGLLAAPPAVAQEECVVGEITMFAGDFAPRGYDFAHGQTIDIVRDTESQILYSILGVSFGGDGQRDFKMPDLRGRVPIGSGFGGRYYYVNARHGTADGAEVVAPQAGTAAAGTGAVAATPDPLQAMAPYTGVNYLICSKGEYPRRN